jgi:hypothetical protein
LVERLVPTESGVVALHREVSGFQRDMRRYFEHGPRGHIVKIRCVGARHPDVERLLALDDRFELSSVTTVGWDRMFASPSCSRSWILLMKSTALLTTIDEKFRPLD